MREGWHKTTIGTLISSGAIKVHKDGNHGANYPRVDDFGTDGLPFLTAKSISDWTIDFQGAPRLSCEKAKTFKFGFVEGGDVLLSHNATVGRVAIVPEGEATAVIGTSLTQFRVDRSQILPEFLALYFSSREFQEQLSFVMAQTTRNQVPITEQRKLPIQLPDLGAQQAIVDVAFGLIDKIELNRKMNATLEAMARALFRDWFIDFGPTRAKMAGAAPYLSPDLWSLFPDRLDAEGKPEGWEVGTLNDLASLNPESWTARNAPARVSYVDLANTKWGSIDKVEEYAWSDAPSRARRVLRAGDTIVGTVRPGNGSLCYIGEDGLTGSTGFAALRPKNARDKAFVWCAATSPENIDRLAHLADGGAYPAVRPEAVATTEIVIPSADVLNAFRSAVSANLDLMGANRAESRTLAQTRDLLLPRLMSGALRVAEVESLAKEVV